MKTKTIEERVKEIAINSLGPSEYTGKVVLDEWIFNAEELTRKKRIYKLFPFLENEKSILDREYYSEVLEQYKLSKNFLLEIKSSKDLDLDKVKSFYLEIKKTFEEKLLGSADHFFWYPSFIDDFLFQFPDTAKKILEDKFLNKKLEELSNCRFYDCYDHYTFIKYAEFHKGLTEQIIKKIGEIYKYDKEERIKGKRKIKFVTLEFDLPALTYNCISHSEELGKKISLDKEKSLSLAGITELDIEEDKESLKKEMESKGIFDPLLHAFYLHAAKKKIKN